MTNKNNATNEVRNAIANTIQFYGEYFKNTCHQRLEDGIGSVYDGMKTVEQMTNALKNAVWAEATHPDVLPDCKAYKTTDIKGGHYGLVEISCLDDDAVLTAIDPKNTGFAELEISGVRGRETRETWLIVGEEDNKKIVFTFHPGKPVRPSQISVSECPVGAKLTKTEALTLGFIYAKVC